MYTHLSTVVLNKRAIFNIMQHIRKFNTDFITNAICDKPFVHTD